MSRTPSSRLKRKLNMDVRVRREWLWINKVIYMYGFHQEPYMGRVLQVKFYDQLICINNHSSCSTNPAASTELVVVAPVLKSLGHSSLFTTNTRVVVVSVVALGVLSCNDVKKVYFK